MQKDGMVQLTAAGCSLIVAFLLGLAPQSFAEDNVPATDTGNGDVQSRGFSLPKVSVPPPPAMQPLTVRTTGEGGGKVTMPPASACLPGCSASDPQGAPVVLAAVPAPGSTFAGWGGDCRGTAPCTITMDRARTVEAKFNKNAASTPSSPSPYVDRNTPGKVLQDGRNDGKITVFPKR